MTLDRNLIESLIFRKDQNYLRFTQDSPVYPDVWFDYYEHRDELDTYRADLILTPHRKSSAAELFHSFSLSSKDRDISKWEMATNGETVVAKLTLREMITIALPKTQWWQNYLTKDGKDTLDYKWFQRLLGAIRYASYVEAALLDQTLQEWLALFENIFANHYHVKPGEFAEAISLWSISRNRTAVLSIEKSVPATKADAGRRLFNIDGKDIAWAVMDSGVDARHGAFRKTDPKTGRPFDEIMGGKTDKFSNNTRITATYDFTNFRQILVETYRNSQSMSPQTAESLVQVSSDKQDQKMEAAEINRYLRDIDHDLQNGRQLDWSVMAPLLRIPHNVEEYVPPQHPHGTHVAGILGANLVASGQDSSFIGMCPGIELYDIRVMNATGQAQEFNILAAIQFIRWLNNQKDALLIHGVNMSFSMTHEVASYACGQTPVCVACERLVSEGTVVVVAAGNLGQSMYVDPNGLSSQGFRMVNITDPGNAEKVITVGATHRNQPHAYGVSYFSSKGPTGDGRVKPDLVAPGEKIVSVSLDDGDARMDGTSMAAPHVSGAAALILAKHRELIGRPGKIKELLCRTATDLGREKYFQGCGMVDVLRAIQSV